MFLLALTSNPGADDFQLQTVGGEPLYKRVVTTALHWADGLPGHLGFVTGATRPEYLAEIRALAPDNFFLVPGVGAQGGDLDAVCLNGKNDLERPINASRSIIFASSERDFAQKAAEEAAKMQLATAAFLS